MEAKQLNARIPQFVHNEWVELKRSLRELGTKPTDGDLVAALIHAASASAENTRSLVEAFVVDELAKEDAEGP
jgi:hypothetical protein